MGLPTPNPATNRQVPDQAIMDLFGKQAYLGNQFVASTGAVALADTSEAAILYLANAATNSKALFNSARSVFNEDPTNLVTFRVYFNPTTVTSGSAITPVNCRPANPLTSVSACKKSVSVSTKGTFVMGMTDLSSFGWRDDTLLIIDPGQSMLITAQGAAGTPTVFIDAVWWEL